MGSTTGIVGYPRSLPGRHPDANHPQYQVRVKIVALSLDPEDAFGDYDPGLLRVEPREAFAEVLQEGMRFEGVPGDAPAADLRVYTVTGIADDKVVVDGNHPLAGERVWFKCTVQEVRPATDEELRHGHAHGEHAPEEGEEA